MQLATDCSKSKIMKNQNEYVIITEKKTAQTMQQKNQTIDIYGKVIIDYRNLCFADYALVSVFP
jgi:hypothetical protein